MANRYLAAIERARMLGREEAIPVETQFMADCAIVALHRVFGFGADRIGRFVEEMSAVHNHYNSAFRVRSNPECDVLREHLDADLRECVAPDKFEPWSGRYPTILEVSYGAKKS